MINAILPVLGLWWVQTLIPSTIRYLGDPSNAQQNLGIALRGRDNPPPMPVIGARATRALDNLHEALPIFLTLALLLHTVSDPGVWATRGAFLFFVARVLYVPAYLSAIPGLRSFIWVVSQVGLAAMAWSLVG